MWVGPIRRASRGTVTGMKRQVLEIRNIGGTGAKARWGIAICTRSASRTEKTPKKRRAWAVSADLAT